MPQREACNCDEVHFEEVSREDHRGAWVRERYRSGFPVPAQHDCDYVAARNALLPEAERWANLAVGTYPDTPEQEAEWNAEFHAEVERLVRRAGIRRASYYDNRVDSPPPTAYNGKDTA